jgi:hypothetical protein
LVDDPAVDGNPLENYTDPHAITPATLTINPRPLRVAVISESRVYGEANPLFRHVASNAVNGDAFNVTYATSADAGTNVGTYDVTVGSVTPVGGGPLHNYTVVNTNAGQLTITPRPLTVTPEAKVVTYGDEITLTGNVVGAYAPDLSSARLVIGYTTTPEHNGQASETPYTINSHATGAAIDAGNYATDLRTATLTINRAPLDIFADHYTRQVGEDNPAFTGTITEGQVKNNDVIEVTGSTTANASSPAGTYAIIPDAVGERIANYFIRSRTNGVLTVEAPASSVVTGLIGVSSTEALVGTVRINAGSLFSIDAATGTATVIGAHGILGCLGPKTSAVAVDPLTGQLYGMIGGSAGGSKLIRIDRTSGTGTVVGDLVGPGFNGAACQGGSDALTFSSDGTLYASGWFGGTISGGSLLRVNKATGAVLSAQRTTGGIFFAGLVFAADGTLWASRGGNGPGLIHTIDPATGQTITTIQLRTASGANDFARVSDLAFDSEGTLWASLPQENMLATINTTTGVITRVGSFGPNTTRMSGLAFAP